MRERGGEVKDDVYRCVAAFFILLSVSFILWVYPR